MNLLKVIKLGNLTIYRQFHTTSSNKANPLVWFLAKSISKLGAIIYGRSVRKWWQKLPNKKRIIFLNHIKRNFNKYLAIGCGITVSSSAFYLTHIEEHPITHRRRLILFNLKQLNEIELLGVKNILENRKILTLDSEHTKRCLEVCDRLYEANKGMPGVGDMKWELTLIDDDNINNATAFPSGRIIVYSGLLKFCQNDDELASILGHEMAHVILMHGIDVLSQQQFIDIMLIFLTGLLWTIIPSDSLAFLSQLLSDRLFNLCFSLPYSRFIEQEADEFGIELAARACFDVRKIVSLWDRMSTGQSKTQDEKINKNNKTKKKSKEPLEFLSTHPSDETRSRQLATLIPNALLLRKQCNCKELD